MNTAKITLGEHQYPLNGDLVTVGRANDNVIVLEDESVSGHHAEIRTESGRYLLRDLGSTNGTTVNGITVQETPLNDGDLIHFGGLPVMFQQIEKADIQASRLPKESFGQKVLRAGQAAAKSAKKMALVAAKQAQRKKLEMVDLPAADRTIGTKAIECGLFKEEFQAIYEELSVIEARIALLKQARELADGASFGDTAKHAALVGKDQVQLEAASFKRNGVITKLGKAILESTSESPLIADYLSSAYKIVEQMETLDTEIVALKINSSSGDESQNKVKEPRLKSSKRNLIFAAAVSFCAILTVTSFILVQHRDSTAVGITLESLKNDYPDLDSGAVKRAIKSHEDTEIIAPRSRLILDCQNGSLVSVLYPLESPPSKGDLWFYLNRHSNDLSWSEHSHLRSTSESPGFGGELRQTFTRSDGRLVLDYRTRSYGGKDQNVIWIRTTEYDSLRSEDYRKSICTCIPYVFDPADYLESSRHFEGPISNIDYRKIFDQTSFSSLVKEPTWPDMKPWEYLFTIRDDGAKFEVGVSNNALHFIAYRFLHPVSSRDMASTLAVWGSGMKWQQHEAPLRIQGKFFLRSDGGAVLSVTSDQTDIFLFSPRYARWAWARLYKQ